MESIRNIQYIDLLRDYFSSNEFRKSVVNLKEDKDYINISQRIMLNFSLITNHIEGNNTNQRLRSSIGITPNHGANNITPNPEYHPFIFEVEPILDWDDPIFLVDGMLPSGDFDLLESLNSFSNDNLIELNRSLNFDMTLN